MPEITTQEKINKDIAQSAYNAFKEIKDSNEKEDEKKKLYQHAKRMPMRIINSGLANALLFKYKDHEKIIDKLFAFLGIKDNTLVLTNRDLLRLNTIKALKWLEWFNKFADTEKE